MFDFSNHHVLLTWLLSAIIFLPAAGAFLLCLTYRADDRAVRRFALIFTIIVFVLTLWLALPVGTPLGIGGLYEMGNPDMQNMVCHNWIPSFDIHYFLGFDGISLPLVILTSFISMLAMWASWPITKSVRAYCILFLLLETGMLGVFLSLDFFLFYVFWEVMLLPMYFLIGIWGGPRREYAAIKFFLFTLVGSVLMLVAILVLYFYSDVHLLTPKQLVACRVVEQPVGAKAEIVEPTHPHTFNIMALAKIGQLPDVSRSPVRRPIRSISRCSGACRSRGGRSCCC